MKSYIQNLQQQLRDKGIEPQPPPSNGYASSLAGGGYFDQAGDAAGMGWGGGAQQNDYLQAGQKSARERHGSQPSLLSDFRPGCIGDNYLGVSSGNSWLSPIEGTSLSLFGAKLDLAEFMPADAESASSGTSYQSFLNHAFSNQPTPAPQLPPWEQAKIYAEWYFRSLQPFLPVLHKPHFMRLLQRVYHEGYQPNASESVMVHMVFAILNYQYTTRNTGQQSRQQNYDHWYHSLSFVPQLIKGHTLEDLQALTMICAELRNYPRPGACWMFTNTVLGLAIELGLHRSVTAWQGQTAERDPHTIEMRKRVFWSLLMIHVPVSGKLGRPMPLRSEDFDIEIPEDLPDNLPEESDLDEWKKCSWRAGKYGFKMIALMMKVYSTIYSIRATDANYDTNVRHLEKDMKNVIASFPPELSGGSKTKDESRVSALYLQFGAQGVRLLIHHPALCKSSSPQVMSANLDACLDASRHMLSIASQLKMLKSLDTTLYYNMDFLAAMFTTLFAYTERRDVITSSELQRLRDDMDLWLDIMGDVGSLLGTGDRLQMALRRIVEWSIGNVNRHLVAKTASAAVTASTGTSSGQETPTHQLPERPASHASVYNTGHTADYSQQAQYTHSDPTQTHGMPAVQTQPQQTYTMPPPPPMHTDSGYSTATAYTYTDTTPQQQPNPLLAYNASNTNGFYEPQQEDMKPNIDAQFAAMQQQPPTTNTFLQAFHSPTDSVPGFSSPGGPPVGPTAWRNFAEGLGMGMHMGGSAAPASMGASNPSFDAYATQPMQQQTPMATPGGRGAMQYPQPAVMGNTAAMFGEMQQMPMVQQQGGGQQQQGGQIALEWPLIQY